MIDLLGFGVSMKFQIHDNAPIELVELNASPYVGISLLGDFIFEYNGLRYNGITLPFVVLYSENAPEVLHHEIKHFNHWAEYGYLFPFAYYSDMRNFEDYLGGKMDASQILGKCYTLNFMKFESGWGMRPFGSKCF